MACCLFGAKPLSEKWWAIVNGSLVNISKLNFNQNTTVFFDENVFANIFLLKWPPFCLGLNVITYSPTICHYCRPRSTRWRHQMETFSALLAICAGNSPVPVNSPHKGQWRGALVFSLICAWINDWVNNREAGDLRRRRSHYDVIVMTYWRINGVNIRQIQEAHIIDIARGFLIDTLLCFGPDIHSDSGDNIKGIGVSVCVINGVSKQKFWSQRYMTTTGIWY